MATIFSDDFESYSNGDLNGQGSWVDVSTSFDIQDSVVKEGTKAVSCTTDSEVYAKKTGTARSDGRITVYVRVGQTDQRTSIDMFDSGDNGIIALLFKEDGTIEFTTNPTTLVDIQSYSADQWYCVETEWRSSDNKARYRVDEGTWTDWYACVNNGDPNTITQVWLGTRYISGTSTAYFDYISEDPIPTPEPVVDPWTNQAKNSATYTNASKNTASYTNTSKNSSTWTNQSKN